MPAALVLHKVSSSELLKISPFAEEDHYVVYPKVLPPETSALPHPQISVVAAGIVVIQQ